MKKEHIEIVRKWADDNYYSCQCPNNFWDFCTPIFPTAPDYGWKNPSDLFIAVFPPVYGVGYSGAQDCIFNAIVYTHSLYCAELILDYIHNTEILFI